VVPDKPGTGTSRVPSRCADIFRPTSPLHFSARHRAVIHIDITGLSDRAGRRIMRDGSRGECGRGRGQQIHTSPSGGGNREGRRLQGAVQRCGRRC
jgi:hypothetical protein